MTTLAHHERPVEMAYTGMTIECGSFEMFCHAIGCTQRVFLMPIERVFPLRTGAWVKQCAIHATAYSMAEIDHPLSYATFWAAESTGAGALGRLVFPYQQQRADAHTAQCTCHLGAELLACLHAELDAYVPTVFSPARYWLPDQQVWGVRSSLEGSAIAFQGGHWTSQRSLL